MDDIHEEACHFSKPSEKRKALLLQSHKHGIQPVWCNLQNKQTCLASLKVTRLSPQAWGWTSTVGAGRKLSELLSHLALAPVPKIPERVSSLGLGVGRGREGGRKEGEVRPYLINIVMR